MLKCVHLLICLLVFMLSDALSMICSEHPGTCPPVSVPCDVPLPLLHQDISPCNCDNNCKPSYKCCKTSCYSYKICQSINPATFLNDNALETLLEGSPLNRLDDNSNIIFKQVQDSDTSDKDLKQLSNYQENSVQGHHSIQPAKEVKINIFYNIVKNIHIQNLNVYKGADKTTEGCNQTKIEQGVENVENTENNEGSSSNNISYKFVGLENQGCFDDEDCPINEGSGSGSSPDLTSTETPTTNDSENQGCLDDEDCQTAEGSGYTFEGSGLINEGSGLNLDETHLEQLERIKFLQQYLQPSFATVAPGPMKFKTLDGTHYFFFDEEIDEEENGAEVDINIEKIEIN